MGPRLAMPIILGSGCHLAALRWPTLIPAETILIGWGTVSVWLGLILAIHSNLGHRMPALAQWDLRLRFAVVFTLLGTAAMGFSKGLPDWIGDQDRDFRGAGWLRDRSAIRTEALCSGLHADD